jgi:hypothetical protein
MITIKAFTDYPILELGDVAQQEARIRECEVLTWDRNKYAHVLVEGIVVSFKAGYLYAKPGRFDEVPAIKLRDLETLPSDLDPRWAFRAMRPHELVRGFMKTEGCTCYSSHVCVVCEHADACAREFDRRFEARRST